MNKIPRAELNATLDTLYELFPNTFFKNAPEKVKPLQTGTYKLILEQYPEQFEKTVLRAAMWVYCSSVVYSNSLINGTQRLDLEGNLVGEITDEQKEAAIQSLNEMKAKKAALVEQKNREIEVKKLAKKELENQKVEVVKMIEVVEPVQPIEEVKEDVKPKKLVLKRKIVEPVAEVTIEPTVEIITPVEVETKPAPVKTPKGNVAVAKGLKVTLVIEPATIPNIDSTGKKTITLTIQVANTDIKVTTSLSSKSYRKAMNGIEEFGVDGCNAILQGAMKKYGVIEDAGLVVQPKKVATSEPEAA
ncbi:MAG: ProQ/FinO family protein [Methylococcaceae bacterium]